MKDYKGAIDLNQSIHDEIDSILVSDTKNKLVDKYTKERIRDEASHTVF